MSLWRKVLPILLAANLAFADTSSDSITIRGVVPVILTVTVLKTSPIDYVVHEVSNNPDGYVVTLETDAERVVYDGAVIEVIGGQATLTWVTEQTVIVDTDKTLTLDAKTNYVRVTIRPN